MAKEIEGERKGARCLAVSADVRDIKSMEAAVDTTIKAFGRLDFVIAGAAGNFLATIDVPLHKSPSRSTDPLLTRGRTSRQMRLKRSLKSTPSAPTTPSKPQFPTSKSPKARSCSSALPSIIAGRYYKPMSQLQKPPSMPSAKSSPWNLAPTAYEATSSRPAESRAPREPND
jgi:hypothetical protein